jgi:hypothetical protein
VPSEVDQHSTNTQCSVLNTQSVPGRTKSGTKRTGARAKNWGGLEQKLQKKSWLFSVMVGDDVDLTGERTVIHQGT